ncbi:MAG: phosphate acyltransferase PlsX [Dehalococcoidia bacterium]|tara:strand:- start:62 stop:1069 length:1008 start_codon:yes stop_codon:yes gene_type:complete
MKQKLTIAIDAMGGDNAPEAPVEGAIKASQNDNNEILLVGDPIVLQDELKKHDSKSLPIKIIPSEGKIEDGESPAMALRQKPKSSILVSTGLVKKGLADAVVSMGSTGGTMAAAVVVLGTIEGIERPAIGGPVIGSAPNQTILDLGSNIDCKPSQLLGFGVLGSVFSELLLKVTNPKIGILSVGSEEGKGNSLTKETYSLFQKSDLNFIGNIEGNDLITGKADVVVCDGFVGNIVLKLVEGLGKGLAAQLQDYLTGKIDPNNIESLLKDLYQKNNVTDSRGGGPVYGVNGVSIVGHGSATSGTIERAVNLARMCIETKLIEEMGKKVPAVMSTIN